MGEFSNNKCADFGVERTTRKHKKSSVPKSTNLPTETGPIRTKDHPTKSMKLAGMPTNNKLCKKPENVRSTMTYESNRKHQVGGYVYKLQNMQETRRSTKQSTNVVKNVKFGKNYLLENVSYTRTVKFEKEIVETKETRSGLVRNVEEESHQNRSQNRRKRLEGCCEDKPSNRKVRNKLGQSCAKLCSSFGSFASNIYTLVGWLAGWLGGWLVQL